MKNCSRRKVHAGKNNNNHNSMSCIIRNIYRKSCTMHAIVCLHDMCCVCALSITIHHYHPVYSGARVCECMARYESRECGFCICLFCANPKYTHTMHVNKTLFFTRRPFIFCCHTAQAHFDRMSVETRKRNK